MHSYSGRLVDVMASTIYTNTQPDIALYSSWNCHTVQVGGGQFVYKIVNGPSSSTGSVTFEVSIPKGAYIKRVWLSMTVSSPVGGARYRMVNSRYIPPSGIVELDKEAFTSALTEYQATFSFQANGVVYNDYVEHTAVQIFEAPTINVEYVAEGDSDIDIDVTPDTSNTADNDPSDGRFLLPRLLDANLVEVTRLHPERLRISLNINPLSTAHMTLPEGEPEVKIRDFVELFTPAGSVGVYRVCEAETTRGINGGQELYLEHALTTLADSLPVDVQAMSAPVHSVLATLLEAQTVKHWVLGDCEVPVDYEMAYEHTYDDILKVLVRLVSLLPEGYAIECNTRIYPWRLHIRKMPDDAFCECRMSRNLTSARIHFEDSDLCTRLYPFGAGEGKDRISLENLTGHLYMDSETVDTWGVVAKTVTEENISDALTLREVAAKYLDRHKNPTLSVELDAYDLYAATGQPLDHFRMGRMCRVALPTYNTVMYERVIAKDYEDVYNNPDKVSVTLANKVKTMADEIADLMREATNTKLLGGTIETEEITSSTSGIYVEDPYGMKFDVKEYGNLLSVKLTYTCRKSGTAESVGCRIYVDGKLLSDNVDIGGTAEILKYLKTDENGVPLVGEHEIGLSPKSTPGVEHYVNVRLLIKTIEK